MCVWRLRRRKQSKTEMLGKREEFEAGKSGGKQGK